MSQQGADDWWQKLYYEDPDTGPDPDPRDTLDHRFRSAAVLVARPAVPAPRRDPERPAERAPAPASGPPEPVPESWPVPDDRPPALGTAPGSAALPEPEAAYTDSVLPPPRDPREGGQTWYALGDVAVPPALPAEAEPGSGFGPGLGPGFEPGSSPGAGSGWDSGPDSGAGSGPGGQADPGPAPGLDAGPGPGADSGADADADGDADGARASGPEPVEEPVPPRPAVTHLGDRPPTYAAEPVALPAADPGGLDALTPDTVLEGAQYGAYTLRAASLRGDSARFRGEARRDFLLTARFGSGPDALVLVVLAGGDRAAPGAAEAAAEVCRSVAGAVGRSQERLADDIRAGRREALRSGLQRLTDRGYGRLRARAADLGLEEDAYTAGLRALLLPVDPQCRTRVCFGAGSGGLFRLRAGQWRDLEEVPPADAGGFRFRASVARPGDTLLLCSGGFADPMREEEPLSAELAARWSRTVPPGLAAFLADTQLRLKGYADDRTAAAVWEA
ncbi:protein phosphatase 2C domain-containing protein [Streptomyces sp. ISL-43]|uniref:protein phosphatase 2C domain-containing protein n=1 Tax=Streptomyces sp. ISL-43 TaxID=2819183 RepID=UPI001BEC1271|nr:protein phosphatase 2C domain-containing protein [Streptomyces sp. ISL-43]MBT2446503.1 protein phosphatase 2C domain-containing protein [Streptomyces sp. ISL-43]